jgi:5'-nucleotidase
VIESSPHLSAEYVKATRKLAEHYIPLEHDHRLGLEEKRKAMEDWYHEAHDCMLAEDVSEARLAQIVEHAWSTCAIHLRNKCAELFQLSLALKIPITVLSAGISDVIEDILKLERIPIDDVSEVMVVGNRMIFNDSGKHVGFSEPVIHSLNKRDALSHALNHSEVRAQRPYALLMGDLIGDVDFVHSIPNLEEYIAIGFLSDPWSDTPTNDIEDRIDAYLKHFDIVILNGAASMDVPLELLKVLFS